MIKIRIAELNIQIHNRFPFCARFCRDYIVEFETPDITVEVEQEELEQEKNNNQYSGDDGYIECVCVYRHIALQLPRFNAMVFHASVVECDGVSYAFAAHSGTGKSTHTNLWLRVFRERARIINGDKPIFRLIDGKWRVFGTPWRGKERLGENLSSPLAAICFIERGKKNVISAISGHEMVARLFSQVLIPYEADMAEKHLNLMDRLVCQIPTFLLHCNMLPEAALVAHEGMSKEITNDSE